MSDKKQRRLLKRREKHKKTGDRSEVDQVHDVLESCRCILPEIGNGCLITQGKSKVTPKGTGEKVSICPPPLRGMGAAQERVKKLSSSVSRLGFADMPIFPPINKQDCSNKVNSQLKQDTPRPFRLPPIDNVVLSSSCSVGHEPKMAVLRPLTGLSTYSKLPDIKKREVKCGRPVSGTLDPLPFIQRPVSGMKEEVNKNIKLLSIIHCAEGHPRVDKAKKNKKLKKK